MVQRLRALTALPEVPEFTTIRNGDLMPSSGVSEDSDSVLRIRVEEK